MEVKQSDCEAVIMNKRWWLVEYLEVKEFHDTFFPKQDEKENTDTDWRVSLCSLSWQSHMIIGFLLTL